MHLRPNRIVSTVPSLTELLFDLGLEERIVGRTRYCIHPHKKVDNVAVVGGTKNLNIEKIKELKPDLVIASKEENAKEQIEALTNFVHVHLTNIKTIADSLRAIEKIDLITQSPYRRGSKLIEEIKQRFDAITPVNKRCVYLIWQKPFMTIGNDTYIHDVLKAHGYSNCFQNKFRYPEISVEEIENAQPDSILLSSEPYPFTQKHKDVLQKLFPKSDVKLTDGEYWSWYGSRILKKSNDALSQIKQ